MSKLVHVGVIHPCSQRTPKLLFLRQDSPAAYTWYQENEDHQEESTSISASSAEEALRIAHLHWRADSFRPLICGFRYSLPERDEHGNNAWFYQMASSYASSNGVYFDEDLGYLCIVQNAPLMARNLWKKLELEKRL